MRFLVPAIVLSLAAALAAVVMIPLATGAEADYARLFPDPGSVGWRQGEENFLWLYTNLAGVELRISGLDSVGAEPALGFGSIQSRNEMTGVATTLGRAGGCGSAYADDNGTVDRDDDYTAFWVPAGSGLGLVACEDSAAQAAATEGNAALYSGPGPGAVELASYAIDAAVRPAPPQPNRAPSFGSAYTTRRLCVDRAYSSGDTAEVNRAGYLSGLEYAGQAVTATDADTDTLSYSLGIGDPNYFYLFFEVTAAGELRVLASGAADHSGLDADAVYPIVLTASDGRGGTDQIAVGVWLDAGTVSSGDGAC